LICVLSPLSCVQAADLAMPHPVLWGAALLVKKVGVLQIARTYGIPRLYRRILEFDRRTAPVIVERTPLYAPLLAKRTAAADPTAVSEAKSAAGPVPAVPTEVHPVNPSASAAVSACEY
jgi:hypothetical protein